MTDEEILEGLKAYTSKPEVIDKALKGLKSLEAWGKVKEEILNPNEMDCFENSNIWQVWFLKIIDKHLSEVSE